MHTVGGLSAHADQSDLGDWYGAFEGAPPVWLVHGEPAAQRALCDVLVTRFGAPAAIAATRMPITA